MMDIFLLFRFGNCFEGVSIAKVDPKFELTVLNLDLLAFLK